MVTFSDDGEFPEIGGGLEIRNDFISELGLERIMERELCIARAPLNREIMREYAEQCMNFNSKDYSCLKQRGFFDGMRDLMDISSNYLNASILCFVGGLGSCISDQGAMSIGFYSLSFGLVVGGVVDAYMSSRSFKEG
ncbi:hypothetical protein HOD75_03535 [archaeon]|jgi:hypothetical protein|nr:hypothetical protein [archaeon]MBT4241945.1 hypothetical protein [archaeon]MBT4418492.1 hypothetical protein [archaeon]